MPQLNVKEIEIYDKDNPNYEFLTPKEWKEYFEKLREHYEKYGDLDDDLPF